ncbi:ThiF family adenylyltransferase [Microvirga puerhi]|uniref:ThiF family adenylyltransferase n=1 Tax=Microvirga puerhi TaxID=2876078 RepID=A0ABS7VTD1_9HYPH|nr:ThiF family adenylyltransferase [Microvirga puerhi]MBZ6078828.1 ThiF family adenylyltransferase [Microvirga puerhi]
MSLRLISRSPDLQRVRDEGFDLEVRNGVHLLVKKVPYVTAQREVRLGTLVFLLNQLDDVAQRPSDHRAFFAGEMPCHADGSPMTEIILGPEQQQIDPSLITNFTFSQKPARGYYQDCYEQLTTYIQMLESQAQAIEPSATARTRPVVELHPDESVFCYPDSASSRAGITYATQKLAMDRVAIVGLGGTGSYILDLLAKTPVKEIHLFDGDVFSPHNAFRAPGAASLGDLKAKPNKVDHFAAVYSQMRHSVIPHAEYINEENVSQLNAMNFVFVCVDKGGPKKIIANALEQYGVPFIDVGMGIYQKDNALDGIVRVTTSTASKRNHVHDGHRIPFSDRDGDDEYDSNIQIADLNALNAALAVVKWKKICGFYWDFDHEHFSTYTIDGNHMINEDKGDEAGLV